MKVTPDCRISETNRCCLLKDDEEGDEDDDDEGSEMELDEDFPDINAAPHIRFERFDRDDDLIIEFDNMFSNNGKALIFQNVYINSLIPKTLSV